MCGRGWGACGLDLWLVLLDVPGVRMYAQNMSTTRYVSIIARWDRLTPDEAREVSALLRASRVSHYGMKATRGEYDDHGSYGLRVGTRKRIA